MQCWTNSSARFHLRSYGAARRRKYALKLWRTCIADRSELDRPADPEYGGYMEAFKYNTFLKYTTDYASGFRGPPETRRENITPQEQELLDTRDDLLYLAMSGPQKATEGIQGVALFSAALGSACQGKCFAVTEKGYMAIAPPGTKEGDMVCLVMGAEVPFILRPLLEDDKGVMNKEQCYALVGECYIHGIMDGEGLRQGLEEQYFVIR